MANTISMKIGGMVLGISSTNALFISRLRDNYPAFVSQEKITHSVDIFSVPCFEPATGGALPEGPVHFSTSYLSIAFDPEYCRVAVACGNDAGIVDVLRCVLGALVIQKGGLLLHACAVADGESTVVFPGPSGRGKTTIARLSTGKDVLTDETAVIVPEGDAYYAYATPFAGELGQTGVNRGAALRGVFFLRHADECRVVSLTPAAAACEFARNVIIPAQDPGIIDKVLANIGAAAEGVSCGELLFTPTDEAWRCVDEYTGHGSKE